MGGSGRVSSDILWFCILAGKLTIVLIIISYKSPVMVSCFILHVVKVRLASTPTQVHLKVGGRAGISLSWSQSNPPPK